MSTGCKVGKIRNPISGRCVLKKNLIKGQKERPKEGPKEGPKKSIKQYIIIKCGPTNYINPRTKRCVQLKNPDIKKIY